MRARKECNASNPEMRQYFKKPLGTSEYILAFSLIFDYNIVDIKL